MNKRKRSETGLFGARLKPLLFLALLAVVALMIFTRNRLNSNFYHSNATITRVDNVRDSSGNFLIQYRFINRDGEQKSGQGFYPVKYPEAEALEGKTLPMVVYKRDEAIQELLIYPQSWKQYGLGWPDSLNWLKNYIDAERALFTKQK